MGEHCAMAAGGAVGEATPSGIRLLSPGRHALCARPLRTGTLPIVRDDKSRTLFIHTQYTWYYSLRESVRTRLTRTASEPSRSVSDVCGHTHHDACLPDVPGSTGYRDVCVPAYLRAYHACTTFDFAYCI